MYNEQGANKGVIDVRQEISGIKSLNEENVYRTGNNKLVLKYLNIGIVLKNYTKYLCYSKLIREINYQKIINYERKY
ncbi:MAG: hypothetical protein ACLFVR_14445 [Thiohalospira sp.]